MKERRFGMLAAVAICSAPALAQEDACSAAQARFNDASASFQTAYYQRAGATGTAESLAQDEIAPALDGVQASCSADVGAAAQNIADQLTAMLQDPMRDQLVECDKAWIAFGEKVALFNNTVGGADILVDVVDYEVKPAKTRLIEACPHIANIAEQTETEINRMYGYIEFVDDNAH